MSFPRKLLKPKSYVVSFSFLLVLVVGIADYLTDVQISLVLFYLIPVSFVTWFAGRREGMFISAFSTVVSLTNDSFLTQHYYSHPAIPFWNAIMRGGVFIIVTLLLSRVQIALIHEKESSRMKSKMLSLINHLNLAMTSTLDLHSVGKSLLETIELLFPGCAITIRLLKRETGDLEPLASFNLDERQWRTGLPTSPLAQAVLEIMAPLSISNVQTDARTRDIQFFRSNGLVSFLGLPLTAGGDSLGVLCVYNRDEHEFTNEEIAFFNTVAGQTAIALQNARLFEEVRSSHAQLRDLSRRLLEMQESERRHVARELHDEIGQILTGLKLTLEMTARFPFQESSIRLGKAQLLVNELISRVRRLSVDLRPSMLDDLGLLPTLLWHIERYTTTTGVEVSFNQHGMEGKRFASQLETAAYRIVQEALTNVARHARVQHAMVHVGCMPDTLVLKIQDEGTGFDFETAIQTGQANGLTGMRERTILLGGELSIDSRRGAGTCIVAELPLSETRESIAGQWTR